MSIKLSNYDKGIEELTEIVNNLEKNQLTLAESIELYKKGIKLHKELVSFLEKEEGKLFLIDKETTELLEIEKNIVDGQVKLEL